MSKLIGTNPNQVPSNADLGSAAFMDKKEFLLSKGSEMSAIDAVIPKTAVDVFIYDTSLDSDSGAWRKRTQHTSWYNEKLNTTTRGSRKEFPAVAIIVAESARLTIYDGDDPSISMWMVFDLSGSVGSASNMIPRGAAGTESSITSIASLNAKLIVGLKAGQAGEGLIEINFIPDFSRVYREEGSGYTGAVYNLPISGRNSNGSYEGDFNELAILKQTVNDVAMTVLPNAPVDSVTGLPIPTIAVALGHPGGGQQEGTTIIRDNGTTVDLNATTAAGGYACETVAFLPDNTLVANQAYTGAYSEFLLHKTLPTSDQGISSDTIRYRTHANANGLSIDGNPNAGSANHIGAKGLVGTKDGFALGFNNVSSKVSQILRDDQSNPVDNNIIEGGAVNYITSTYNTGWMLGDIKVALSDTNNKDISRTNIHTNSSIDSSTGWTLDADGNWTISGGTLNSAGNSTPSFAWPAFNFEYNKQYIIQFDISSYTSGTLELSSSTGGTTHTVAQATGTYKFIFTVTGNQILYFRSNSFVESVDNVYYYETEPDRSVHRHAMEVFGTIKKTPVAAGADLVAYSGFSNSTNYLRYKDYTTQNFDNPARICIMGWQKLSDITDYGYVASVYSTTSGVQFGLSTNASSTGSPGTAYLYDSTNSALSTTRRVDDDKWHFIVGLINGTQYKEIYIDGVLENRLNAPTSFSLGTTNVMNVGHYTSDGSNVLYSNRGSIALVRIINSIPTPEQIKKIYEDEKRLFEENAKCTLYGSSDAVTALAYDISTELLHVGTSAGRSVFQGLRRVDNTTDAVGTVISAVNGMVVEE